MHGAGIVFHTAGLNKWHPGAFMFLSAHLFPPQGYRHGRAVIEFAHHLDTHREAAIPALKLTHSQSPVFTACLKLINWFKLFGTLQSNNNGRNKLICNGAQNAMWVSAWLFLFTRKVHRGV